MRSLSIKSKAALKNKVAKPLSVLFWILTIITIATPFIYSLYPENSLLIASGPGDVLNSTVALFDLILSVCMVIIVLILSSLFKDIYWPGSFLKMRREKDKADERQRLERGRLYERSYFMLYLVVFLWIFSILNFGEGYARGSEDFGVLSIRFVFMFLGLPSTIAAWSEEDN